MFHRKDINNPHLVFPILNLHAPLKLMLQCSHIFHAPLKLMLQCSHIFYLIHIQLTKFIRTIYLEFVDLYGVVNLDLVTICRQVVRKKILSVMIEI